MSVMINAPLIYGPYLGKHVDRLHIYVGMYYADHP
jgi:hypothetical protein